MSLLRLEDAGVSQARSMSVGSAGGESVGKGSSPVHLEAEVCKVVDQGSADSPHRPSRQSCLHHPAKGAIWRVLFLVLCIFHTEGEPGRDQCWAVICSISNTRHEICLQVVLCKAHFKDFCLLRSPSGIGACPFKIFRTFWDRQSDSFSTTLSKSARSMTVSISYFPFCQN